MYIGTIVLITNEQLYLSRDFNFELYPHGESTYFYEKFSKIWNLYDFLLLITDLNKLNPEFSEKNIKKLSLSTLKNNLNLKESNDFWNSRWLFIRNLSNTNYKFILSDDSEYNLKPEKSLRLFYWKIHIIDKLDIL